LGGEVGIWKQARELVAMSDSKWSDPISFPAEKVINGDISLGLMQTLLRSRQSRMQHGRHIKDERK
jgi:hypothetical protein